MNNQEIAHIFSLVAIYLQMKNESAFRIRAYERAALQIESMTTELSETYKKGGVEALMELPGIGEALAKKIEEMITTCRLKSYEKLKKEVPAHINVLVKSI